MHALPVRTTSRFALTLILRDQGHHAEALVDANPGEATVHILHGRVTLVAGDNEWNGSPGDLITVPDSVHSLEGVEDCAVLLTVAKTR